MNMLWIALLSLFVLAEKLIPFGQIVGRVSGLVLVVLGFGSLLLGTAH
jgi:predicted metal-binding membrane protein